jgi:hypothetical protein
MKSKCPILLSSSQPTFLKSLIFTRHGTLRCDIALRWAFASQDCLYSFKWHPCILINTPTILVTLHNVIFAVGGTLRYIDPPVWIRRLLVKGRLLLLQTTLSYYYKIGQLLLKSKFNTKQKQNKNKLIYVFLTINSERF